MNHNQSPEDLSSALHGIADRVDFAPPSATDDEFASIVRKRTHIVRRNRRHQRIGIITSCLALVAVGGVVLVQNLPGSGAPAASVASQPEAGVFSQPAASIAVPTCGAAIERPRGARPLTLLSQVDTADASRFLTQSAPADKPLYTSLGNEAIVPLELLNNSDETLTVASNGYARLVIAQNGVVVGDSYLMREPSSGPTLKPGETTLIDPTGVSPCKGTELQDGDYDVFAFLDADVSTGAASEGADTESMVVYGGPWNIRLGGHKTSLKAESKLCGVDTSQISHFDEPGEPLPADEDGASTTITFEGTYSGPIPDMQAESYETYLISDGKVVASTPAGTKLDLDLGEFGRGDFPTPTVSCDGKTPVQPGKYQIFAIVNYVDEKSGLETQTALASEETTITVK